MAKSKPEAQDTNTVHRYHHRSAGEQPTIFILPGVFTPSPSSSAKALLPERAGYLPSALYLMAVVLGWCQTVVVLWFCVICDVPQVRLSLFFR